MNQRLRKCRLEQAASDESCLLLTGGGKDILYLVRKIVPNRSIAKKNSVGIGGVQNGRSGRFRRLPFMSPIEGSISRNDQLVDERGAVELIPFQEGEAASTPQTNKRNKFSGPLDDCLTLPPDCVLICP